MQSNRLEGKTALITGATSNIGRAIALAYGAEGARVVVSGRDATRGAEVAAASGGTFIAADLDGSPQASEALATAATDALGGRIDILVNSAATYPSSADVVIDEAWFDRMFAVNVKAPHFLIEAVAPRMAEHGGGAIINLGSWVARLGVPSPVYTGTKGAVEAMTRAYSALYGPSGVRVNGISPGVIQEPGNPSAVMMRGTPAADLGTPEAIAPAAVYLASDESAFVHGIVLDVDGGRTGVAVIAA
ncbi:NAD(P)-dependent dehydrogenase (short-subunit alcohol dehydrogenase family) [Solirubrobacter pauli]|uniref:NAD(P)-dependent dehydrogenase (Short-subunit alcohol dehydrogenase family) n=1 Tax=Solirubrobacter pauli TaxID=166793 RepID=A0A660L7Q6_9ACTN|nr:SDR family oxidoreductase [Solirubrobacter pauli]RKQ91098.1 NAD(P)-dependent dehydrogenase (short-subunit alcohol dehydrogenase family) [Solirubrobacter pauli]